MGSNSNKNSQIEILKPQVHLCILGRKSTKFQMNPMKDEGGVDETRFLPTKHISARAITPSKKFNQKSYTTCTSLYHRKEVYIISNVSDERCRRSCGDKIMVGKV